MLSGVRRSVGHRQEIWEALGPLYPGKFSFSKLESELNVLTWEVGSLSPANFAHCNDLSDGSA